VRPTNILSQLSVLGYFDVLAWPVVLLVLIGGFLLLFRPNVGALINRIRDIRTPVASIHTTDTQPREAPPPPQEDAAGPPPSEGDETPPPSPSTEAVQQSGPYVYYWYYEKMYRLAYGTQTLLMDNLNRLQIGAVEAELLPYHEEHLRLTRLWNPAYQYDFSTYVGFLEAWLFVKKQTGRYYATELTRSFLQWMVAEGLGHKTGS